MKINPVSGTVPHRRNLIAQLPESETGFLYLLKLTPIDKSGSQIPAGLPNPAVMKMARICQSEPSNGRMMARICQSEPSNGGPSNGRILLPSSRGVAKSGGDEDGSDLPIRTEQRADRATGGF